MIKEKAERNILKQRLDWMRVELKKLRAVSKSEDRYAGVAAKLRKKNVPEALEMSRRIRALNVIISEAEEAKISAATEAYREHLRKKGILIDG